MSDLTLETNLPAGARVSPPAPDPAAQLAALADAVQTLARSQQSFLDTFRGNPAAGAAAPAPTASGAPAAHVSAGDVRRIVGDLLRDRDARQTRTAGRDRYVRQHLSDLPDAYRRLLPDTDDAAALARAEQDVRQQFRDDLKALNHAAGLGTIGVLAGDPSAAADESRGPGGQRPGDAVDYASLSPLQQITLGLARAARPMQVRSPGPSAPPAPSGPSGDEHAAVFHGLD